MQNQSWGSILLKVSTIINCCYLIFYPLNIDYNFYFCSNIGGVEALLYFKSNVSTDPDPLYPDMEFIVIGGTLSADKGVIFRQMFNIPKDTYDKIWKKYETTPAYQVRNILYTTKLF